MKLHRFFVENRIEGEEVVITDENLLNQWRNVLRFDVGDKAVLFDGGGDEFLCEIVSLAKKEAKLKVLERKQGLVPLRRVTLCMALIKKDNFEMVLEKATELGVSHIVPVQADRSEKKGVNHERAQKILREASEQSGRATVPMLGKIERVDNLGRQGLPGNVGDGELVVFDPRGEKLAREFFSTRDTAPISILIGPEGGFTDSEIESFHARNIPIVSTGPQILRAETAAIVALTLALIT